MTDREKLIEILRVPIYPHELADPAEVVADYLLDNGVTVQRWIPVTERLPEKEGWYQVFTSPDKGHKSINKARYSLEPEWSVNSGKGRWSGSGGTWTNVTHWMPLPEPPKEV